MLKKGAVKRIDQVKHEEAIREIECEGRLKEFQFKQNMRYMEIQRNEGLKGSFFMKKYKGLIGH